MAGRHIVVTTSDIGQNAEKPIVYLETAVLCCVLSHYEERECLPDLEVRISGGEVKIKAIDFHVCEAEKAAELEKLKEYCETCYILNVIKMGHSVCTEQELQ